MLRYLVYFLVSFLCLLAINSYGLLRNHAKDLEQNQSLGLAIYVSEGCINCHSQYARTGTIDTDMWGPPSDSPNGSEYAVLIGNRRQGPDLSSIALRRSREWNRLHLIDPQLLSPGSRMPSYKHLFSNSNAERGEILLDYLDSLRPENAEDWWQQIYSWSSSEFAKNGVVSKGASLYEQLCQQCHGVDGYGDGLVASELARKTRDLLAGDFLFVSESYGYRSYKERLGQVIKYGVPGTSMPGHESLTDENINDLLAYLDTLRGTTVFQ